MAEAGDNNPALAVDQEEDDPAQYELIFQRVNEEVEIPCLQGFTCFFPAVSVGNIGQLAIDLVLANLPEDTPPVKIGQFFHPALEPVVGADQYDERGLMTTCEVFLVKEKKYVIIHFHAPVLMRGRDEFVNSFVQWMDAQVFSQVVCLSSIFSADRIDNQLVGAPFRYLATDSTLEPLRRRIEELEWKVMERRVFPAPAVYDGNYPAVDPDEGVLHLPSCGITRMVYETCQIQFVPFLTLIMFASDGDNTPEAMTLYQMADRIFGFRAPSIENANQNQPLTPYERDRIVIPASWQALGWESESETSLY